MKDAEVRVVLSGHGRGEVYVNGHKMAHVRSVKVAASVDETNIVVLEINPSVIEINGVFDVSTIESVAREYVANG